jgi:hypothetical protein
MMPAFMFPGLSAAEPVEPTAASITMDNSQIKDTEVDKGNLLFAMN